LSNNDTAVMNMMRVARDKAACARQLVKNV
jgi:hypothetical protein